MFRTELSKRTDYVREPPFLTWHSSSVRERHAEEHWILLLVLGGLRIGNGKGRLVTAREICLGKPHNISSEKRKKNAEVSKGFEKNSCGFTELWYNFCDGKHLIGRSSKAY